MELTEKEMYEINGGGVCWGAVAAIASAIVFVIGALSGQIKLKWQKLKNTEFIRNSKGKLLIQIQ